MASPRGIQAELFPFANALSRQGVKRPATGIVAAVWPGLIGIERVSHAGLFALRNISPIYCGEQILLADSRT
jgi:hypothetical protein